MSLPCATRGSKLTPPARVPVPRTRRPRRTPAHTRAHHTHTRCAHSTHTRARARAHTPHTCAHTTHTPCAESTRHEQRAASGAERAPVNYRGSTHTHDSGQIHVRPYSRTETSYRHSYRQRTRYSDRVRTSRTSVCRVLTPCVSVCYSGIARAIPAPPETSSTRTMRCVHVKKLKKSTAERPHERPQHRNSSIAKGL